jgi:hypothetical protein
MRRWLAILLLVVLPTQMSWAVVAAYCAHETGAAADHVGHHDHAAHAHASSPLNASDASSNDVDTASGADADCGHCHGQCTGMMWSEENPALKRPPSAPGPAVEIPCTAHTSAQPERPQWQPLA